MKIVLLWFLTLPLIGTLSFAEEPFQHSCPKGDWRSKLTIQVINVGQGDSTFIRTPSGTTVLIDGGNPKKGSNDILPVLKNCYMETSGIDYVVLTHPHKDHYGGLIEVLGNLKVKVAVLDTGNSPGKLYSKYKALADKTAKRRTPQAGELIPSSDDVKIEIIAVNGNLPGGEKVPIFNKTTKEPLDINSVSIAIKIAYGKFQYFTGGDLTGGGNSTPDIESRIADLVGPIEVMKSNHHGSATANNKAFLTKLSPKHIIITVGQGGSNKRYHLPSSDVMARFQSLPSLVGIMQTSLGEGRIPASDFKKVSANFGDVIITASPDSYQINGIETKADSP
jgi:beta-lactamase superfamily II metal-dependent hydrolase